MQNINIYIIYSLKSTKELKGAKIHWKLKTCGTMAHVKQSKSYRKSILKFVAGKLWKIAQYAEKLKVSKKSVLKMSSN